MNINTHAARQAGRVSALLEEAYKRAKQGDTILFIVPNKERGHSMLRLLAQAVIKLGDPTDYNARFSFTDNRLYFEGATGSVRFYTAEHVDYDPAQRRMRGYPYHVKTLHAPELDDANRT